MFPAIVLALFFFLCLPPLLSLVLRFCMLTYLFSKSAIDVFSFLRVAKLGRFYAPDEPLQMNLGCCPPAFDPRVVRMALKGMDMCLFQFGDESIKQLCE